MCKDSNEENCAFIVTQIAIFSRLVAQNTITKIQWFILCMFAVAEWLIIVCPNSSQLCCFVTCKVTFESILKPTFTVMVISWNFDDDDFINELRNNNAHKEKAQKQKYDLSLTWSSWWLLFIVISGNVAT